MSTKDEPATIDPTDAIPVLFKGARVTAHLLQNLALLALPKGSPLETSYGERWLASNAEGPNLPRTGENVLIVLCSSPYTNWVPARWARLEAVEPRGSFYSFQMALGAYVGITDQERLARLISMWDPDLKPHRKFVTRGLADGEFVLARSESEVALAWEGITTRLKSEKDYEGALFARLASAPSVVSPGEPVSFGIQTAAARPVRPVAHLELRQGAAVLETRELRDGVLRVELTADAGESVEGWLRVVADEFVAPALPIRADIQAVTQEERVAATPSPLAVAEAIPESVGPPEAVALRVAHAAAEPRLREGLVLNRVDVRRLVRDAAGASSASELGRRLGELGIEAAPDDAELAARTAHLLIDEQQWAEAADLLGRFDPAELPSDALYDRFLVDCATGRLEDARALLGRVDFETDAAFARLQEALGLLSDRGAVELGIQLVKEALDEGRSLELFLALRDRITDPRHVFEFAEAMQYVSEPEAVDLLLDHTRVEAPDRRLLELLIEIASAIEGNQKIGSQIVVLAKLRLESDDVDGAFELLDVARREARLDERFQLVDALVDTLSRIPGRRDDVVILLSNEIDTALSAGMLEQAAAFAQRAVGVAAGEDAAEAVAHEALDRVERALAVSDSMRAMLALQREARVSAIRGTIGGRRLAIFGGIDDLETKQQLRGTFGFSEVRWFASEKNKPVDASAVRTLDARQTVVVVLTDRIGHSRSTPLIKACETRGMPCVRSERSSRAIEEALLTYPWHQHHSL